MKSNNKQNLQFISEDKIFKELRKKNTDNFTIFLSCSIILHLFILYFFLFGMSSFFEKLPEEQAITFEVLPISDKSNLIPQIKQKETSLENEDAKKSEQNRSKDIAERALLQEEKIKEYETKTTEGKPQVDEEKAIEETKQEKIKKALPEKREEIREEKSKEQEQTRERVAKKPKEKKGYRTDELDFLLKNLEQSSEGDNLKSNKHKRTTQIDNEKEANGVYTERLPLSSSEVSLIKRQIERRWNNIPVGARNNKARVVINIILDRAGNIEHIRVKEKICPNISASVCEALADSAIRAVWQASPIENLDPARFNYWKEINFNFDPSKL